MFELNENMEEDILAVVKVACLGKLAYVWRKNSKLARTVFLEGVSTEVNSWKGTDMGFIVADTRETGMMDKVKQSVEAASNKGILLLVMLIGAEPVKLDVATLSIPSEKIVDENEFCENMFRVVKAIEELISYPCLINLDFADVSAIFADSKNVSLGYGERKGENSACLASQDALEMVTRLGGEVDNAKAILMNVTGSEECISMYEIQESAETVHDKADENCNIIWGAGIDNSMGDTVRVTLVTCS